MEIKDEIKIFTNCRPDVIAAYGYGSGVFRQRGYEKKDKPQIDLILAVKDIKKFHEENMYLNPNDYSITGKVFFNKKSKEIIKGKNKITYQSNIEENGLTFKYGVIEAKDLEHQLLTWDRFFLAGRFQKPVLEIVPNESLTRAIEENRKHALVTALQFEEEYATIYDLYEKIVSFSYVGDSRMRFFENPNKVRNIVNSSFEELDSIYNTGKYFTEIEGRIKVDYDALSEEALPAYLAYYLMDIDKSSKEYLKKIEEYLKTKNKEESMSQAIHGISTNGIVKSSDYAFQKLKKRIYKK